VALQKKITKKIKKMQFVLKKIVSLQTLEKCFSEVCIVGDFSYKKI